MKKGTKSGGAITIPLVIIFILTVYLFRLDQIPGEIYGDIILVYEWAGNILSGKGLAAFFLSVGPLYFYLLAPFIRLFGDSYLMLKTFSVICGLAVIVSSYFFSKYLFSDKRLAFLASFTLAVSKWNLVFSRIGHQIIISATVTSLVFAFLAKYIKERKLLDLIILSIITPLSFYTYIPSWAVPPAVFFILFVLLLSRKIPLKSIVFFSLVNLAITLPLFIQINRDRDNFFGNGYIGNKIFSDSKQKKLNNFMINYAKSLISFNISGDSLFRQNVPKSPHLDPITGIFFIIGSASIIFHRDGKKILLLIFPILVFLIPPSLVVNYPGEIPSIGRSINAMIFSFVISSYGLYRCYLLIRKHNKPLAYIYAPVIFSAITYLNLNAYFIRYPEFLPNHNSPFGKQIASFIEKNNVMTVMPDCCWGEYGQPEYLGVYYALPKDKRHLITNKDIPDVVESNRIKLKIFKPEAAEKPNSTGMQKNSWDYSDSKGQVVFSYLFLSH